MQGMFSVAKLIFVILLYKNFSDCKEDGMVKWKLSTSPAIFGKDVQLECQLPHEGCSSGRTRRWRGGHNLHTLTVNGISANNTKYKEHCDSKTSTSTLTIRFFNERDVNIQYECSHNFLFDKKMLTITKTDFEYHPQGVIPMRLTMDETCNDTVIIKFEKIYPEPLCSSFFQGKDTTDHLEVHVVPNIFLYSALLVYSNNGNHKGRLMIECNVGKSVFIVVNQTINCHTTGQEEQTAKDDTGISTEMVLYVCFVLCAPFICCFLVLGERKKLKSYFKIWQNSKKNQNSHQRNEMAVTQV